MGLGSALMYMAGGAMESVGDGLAEKAKADQEMRRKMIMKQVEQEGAERLARYSSGLKREELGVQYGLMDENAEKAQSREIASLEPKAKIEVATEKAKGANKLANDIALESFRAKLAKSAADEARAAEITAKATEANQTITGWGVNDAGELVGISKTGKQITIAGVKPRPSGKAARDGNSIYEMGGSTSSSLKEMGGSTGGPAQPTPVMTPAAASSSPNARILRYDNKGNPIR